ncbi:MAG: sigma-70 family RNA polymerase sigma factor [Sandaracinaceae bacterium]|nr:sigma-70 family RNA polymerase sigma factor [Sandaracinaceae bacterium]
MCSSLPHGRRRARLRPRARAVRAEAGRRHPRAARGSRRTSRTSWPTASAGCSRRGPASIPRAACASTPSRTIGCAAPSSTASGRWPTCRGGRTCTARPPRTLDRAAEEVAIERAARPEDRAEAAATLAAIDDILGKTCAAFVIAAVGQSPEDDAPETPDEEAVRAEDRARIGAVLGVLDERERALIEGHYFADRTIEEIGAEMGISKSWASRLHSRALGRLRSALEGAG